MTDILRSAEGSIPAELRTCESEPIHIPGHIQPHGILIAVSSEKSVLYASANARPLLLQDVEACIGCSCDNVVTAMLWPFSLSIGGSAPAAVTTSSR